jgi:hypothetical protein
MKALSVRQPWARAIVTGLKPIENRTWQTNYRGPLLIHAGQRDDPDGFQVLESHGIVIPQALPRGRDRASRTDRHRNRSSVDVGAPFRPLRGRLGLFDA